MGVAVQGNSPIIKQLCVQGVGVSDENNSVEFDSAATAAAAAPEVAEDTDVSALHDELERLRQKLAEAEERALRIAAEAQNQRRRAEKDVESAHKFALEKFAGSLLVVADNLERTLESANRDDESIKPFLEGVELTHKGFLDVLARFDIKQVNPVGEPFNPELHEAVSILDNPHVEPNTVLHVMQKGYTLNGRLLRAAMVVVAKGETRQVDTSA
jgi:molecular chaperone GrpE